MRDFYTVTPGEDAQGEPQAWVIRPGDSLRALRAATAALVARSASGGAYTLTVTSAGVTAALREFRGGRETLRSVQGKLPPPGQIDVPEPEELPARTVLRRAPFRETVTAADLGHREWRPGS